MPQLWHLFVDETGKFEDPEKTVAVAGLLVRADVPGAVPEVLLHGLRGAVPDLPWPLHAAFVNQPAYLALALAASSIPRGEQHADHLRTALNAMADGAPREFDRASKAMYRAAEPDWKDIAILSRILRVHANASYLHFEGLGQRVRNTVNHLLRQLHGRGVSSRGSVLLHVASEGVDGNAARGSWRCAADNRYAALLQQLVTRVAAGMSIRGLPYDLEVQVLRRKVIDRHSGRPRPLNVRDVATLIEPIFKSSPLCAWMTFDVYDFDHRVSPFLVLADFAANFSLGEVHGPNRPLASVEHGIESRTGVRPRLEAPPPATLVAATLDTVLPLRGLKKWAQEQAAEWALV